MKTLAKKLENRIIVRLFAFMGIGAGIYKDNREAFSTLEKLKVIEPDLQKRDQYEEAYRRWAKALEGIAQIH